MTHFGGNKADRPHLRFWAPRLPRRLGLAIGVVSGCLLLGASAEAQSAPMMVSARVERAQVAPALIASRRLLAAGVPRQPRIVQAGLATLVLAPRPAARQGQKAAILSIQFLRN